MADDDSVIYVDIEPKLNDSATEKEVTRLRDRFKRHSKVDIEPNLDEAATDRAGHRLRDRLEGMGKGLGDIFDRQLGDVTDKATDKAADKMRRKLDGIGKSFGDALGNEFGNLFNDGGPGVGSQLGQALKDHFGGIQDLFNKGLDLNNPLGQFDELRGNVRETLEGLRQLAPEASGAARALGALSEAAGPLAIALGGAIAVFQGIQDIRHAPTSLDTSPGALGLPTPNYVPLAPHAPGQLPPVPLPSNLPPGVQYQATPGSLNPFDALLPPGMKPPDVNKAPTMVIPSNPLIPSIAPPDTGGGVGTRSAFGGGGIHATLVDYTHPSAPSISGPSDIPGAAGGVRNLFAVAQSLVGTPYSQQLRNDCSGMVSQLAAAAVGLPAPSAGQRFSTVNEGQWLASHGFQMGQGGPNDLNIGWTPLPGNQGHTAATLPGGINAESGGSVGSFALGGPTGAFSPQFSQHAFLPGGAIGGGGGGGFGVQPAGFGIPGLGGGGMGPLPPPTQSNTGNNGPISQQHLGQGQGAGVSGGGLIGAAEQAGVMAAAIGGFGGGGVAAQIAEQEINLAVQKTSQLAYAAASAPLETLWLSGGQMGAPSVQSPAFGWPGKLLSGLIGSQYSSPNTAGAVQAPKQPQPGQQPGQPGQDDPGNGNQSAGPTGSKDDPIHTKSADPKQGPPQGAATDAASISAMAGLVAA